LTEPKSFAFGRLALVATGLVILTIAGLAAEEARRIDVFVALALLQGVAYAVALAITRSPAAPRAFAMIIGVAIVLRLIVSASPVFLSTDIYRYVWDGRVQAAGINPYRYVPNDPALTALRDKDIWPNINRATKAHTIYPPVAQWIYLAAQLGGSNRAAMKAVMMMLEGIGIYALYRILRARGLPRERLIAYAWHPLPIWEIAGSGHIDAALVAFVCLALWAWTAGRQSLAGLALAAATLVKFFPLILAPGLWGRASWRQRDFRLPLVILLLIPLAYLPYIGIGSGVLGYLPGYAREEQLGSGSGLWLVDALHWLVQVPSAFYFTLGGFLLGHLAGRCYLSSPENLLDRLTTLAVVFTFFISPHYAWYFVWLVPLLTLTSTDWLLWPTLVAFLLYCAPTPSAAPLWIGLVIYGGTGLAFLIARALGPISWGSGRSLPLER
jgi:alpha-1,6-mannosyltransferase